MNFYKTYIILLLFFLNTKAVFSQSKNLIDGYFEAVFSGNYPEAKNILKILDKNSAGSLKTKLIFANYFGIMFETNGKEEKYFQIAKKYANDAVKEIINKKNITNEDVFRIISAKSIVLKMEMQKKNYLKAARNMQFVIKYFEYATQHENEDDKMKFISGMYNYYVETAKDDYPVIYPVLIFYPSGDKQKGLKLLKECTISEDKNIRVRSLLQLSLIYFRDEKDIKKSKYYFEKLLDKYPDNFIWQTEYLNALKKHKLFAEYNEKKEYLSEKIKQSKFLTVNQKKYFSEKIEK